MSIYKYRINIGDALIAIIDRDDADRDEGVDKSVSPSQENLTEHQAAIHPSGWTLGVGGGCCHVWGKTYWCLLNMRQIPNRKYCRFSWAELLLGFADWALGERSSSMRTLLLFCFSSLWYSLVKPPCCLMTKVNLGWSHSNIHWSRLDRCARRASHKPGLSHTARPGTPIPVA